jgi:NTP pyrophosphatase (non-canonical NTP hydrolase)
LIYSFAFCIRNEIDITDAIKQKMKKNIKKYPAEDYRGHF